MNAVLDSSALLANLFQEAGQDVVLGAISDGAGMCAVNIAEVVGRLARDGMQPDGIRRLLDALPVDCIDADADLALRAGLMEPLTRPAGLSLGDRFCIALAARAGVPALTADRAWTDIAPAIGVTVTLIR